MNFGSIYIFGVSPAQRGIIIERLFCSPPHADLITRRVIRIPRLETSLIVEKRTVAALIFSKTLVIVLILLVISDSSLISSLSSAFSVLPAAAL